MDSEQKADPKHLVTAGNWREYAKRIHDSCMEKMEVERGSLTELIFLCLAMGGEKEGVCNETKKMWRDGQSQELYKNLRGEIADVLIYIQHILDLMGVSASQVIVEKLQELTERWPHYFEDFEPSKAN